MTNLAIKINKKLCQSKTFSPSTQQILEAEDVTANMPVGGSLSEPSIFCTACRWYRTLNLCLLGISYSYKPGKFFIGLFCFFFF